MVLDFTLQLAPKELMFVEFRCYIKNYIQLSEKGIKVLLLFQLYICEMTDFLHISIKQTECRIKFHFHIGSIMSITDSAKTSMTGENYNKTIL